MLKYIKNNKNNWYKISQSQQEFEKYTVQKKDTLSSIARDKLGNPSLYTEIIKINPQIKDPNTITPGMIINIPKNKNQTLKNNANEQTGTAATFIGDPLSELKSEISKTEGNYNSYNKGKAGDTPKPTIDITKLTVLQIMQMQKERKLFAVGKYQIIPSTLALIMNNSKKWNLGVSYENLFDQNTQEKLFLGLLYKQPKVWSYLSGQTDDVNQAMTALANEFASLPGPSGKGQYDGDSAGNKASGGLQRAEKIKNILLKLRKNM